MTTRAPTIEKKPQARQPAEKKPRACEVDSVHVDRAGKPVDYYISGHTKRTDSPEYVKSRKAMHKIVGTIPHWLFGEEPLQDHHAGGLWVYDGEEWFMVRNLVGIEWSAQFCADPAKVDLLRQNARRLYARFPESFTEFETLGIDLRELLETPITDAEGIARWTDSICNASVPLPQSAHTGVVPKGGGVHNYPTPITDIAFFKHDDFQLWVTDEEGNPTAVVPTHPRGSGSSEIHVVTTEPGSKLNRMQQQAHTNGERLILDEGHPLHAHLAGQAYAKQTSRRPQPS